MRKDMLMALLAAALVCGGCSEKQKGAVKAPVRVKTEVTAMQNSTGMAARQYVGVVEELESTAVSFTSMGAVRRVLVSEGQQVRRGQLLAEMDDRQARSLLSGAEAAMAQANDALQRYGLLHDNGSLPEVQWVEIQSKVAQAQAQLEVARKNLADCRLVAPVDGIIGKKMVGAGETAMPSQTVVTIININNVKVKVPIPEAEMNGVTASTPTTIAVEAAGVETTGGVIEKGVVADALTHTYDIRVTVSNPGHRLLPGMVATVTMAPAEDSASLTVPVYAVQQRADGSLFVWTVDADSTAHRTTVTAGPTVGNRMVVSTGLAAGQCIVTEGCQKLGEGTKVVY